MIVFDMPSHTERKKDVAVVIPIYKPSLSDAENLSYQYYCQFLSHFDTFAISPQSLRLPIPVQKRSFPNECFANVQAYSQLLLSSEFYQSFSEYTYILIYQLDALVLKDELMYWCKQDYDYLGAPWWHSTIAWLTHPEGQQHVVGNGGFSLRKVASHLEVLTAAAKVASHTNLSRQQVLLRFAQAILTGKSRQQWLSTLPQHYPFNEDGFWSFEASKYVKHWRVPSPDVGLRFAIETEPRRSFNTLNQTMPFGVHAWEKYDKAFWLERLARSE